MLGPGRGFAWAQALVAIAALGSVLVPAAARAEPAAPVPADEQCVGACRGRYLHDGFYLRLGAGAGLIQAQFSNGGYEGAPWVQGTAIATEIAIGGAIADGVTIGGREIDVIAPSANGVMRKGWSLESYDANGLMWLSAAQLFFDVYPMPRRGLHVQAGVGPALLRFASAYTPVTIISSPTGTTTRYGPTSDTSSTDWGIAASLAVGWEGWVTPQWSAGMVLSMHAASLWGEPNSSATSGTLSSGSTIMVLAPTLTAVVTYN